MNRLTVLFLTGLLAMTGFADDLKPFAEAGEGYQRMVIRVPAVDHEPNHEVEVMVGKMMEVDCNTVRMSGELTQHTVEGWGYAYYQANISPNVASTMMACPPGSETEKFIYAGGEGFKLRYNSKLPIVLYVPEGYELRYRIWSAADDIAHATVE